MSNISTEPVLIPLSELNTIISPLDDHFGEKSEKVLSDVWSKMRPMSRECYRVKDKPGKIINSRTDVIFKSEEEQNINGFENFSIINCHINTIETLFLHSAGHIRAKYINKNNKFYGNWLIP